ncbi:unnamed protein product [Schistosoma turkestanicum]|nr:unnamed protein product [Schistosoma turkestanicum]
MRIPTAQRIYRNSNQCFYYDYLKFAYANADFFKRRQDRHGFLHVIGHRKEGLPTFKFVELYHGGLSTSVAVFVSRNRSNARPLSQTSVPNECSRYKHYLILLGLAAGLVSLGSLWLYKVFERSSGLRTFESLEKTRQLFSPDESEIKRQYSSMHNDDCDFKQRTSSYSEETASLVDMQVDSDHYFDSYCIHADSELPLRSGENFPKKCITSAHNVTTNNVNYGVQSPYDSSSLWISASMNCPHYVSGSYKICTICWLNMPDYWLHGPTWRSQNGQINSNQLSLNTGILGSLICLQLIYRAIYLARDSVIKQSSCTHTSPISASNAINSEYADSSQQLSAALKFDNQSNKTLTPLITSPVNSTASSDYPLIEHNKTQFHNSKSDQSNCLLHSEVIGSYDINFKKTGICDNQQHNSAKSLSASIDSVLFPSMKDEHTDQTSMDIELPDKDFMLNCTTSMLTDQLFSKVIEFLDPRQVAWLDNSPVRKSSLIHRVYSDSVLDKKTNKSLKYLSKRNYYTAQNTTDPSIYHRSRFHSISSSSSDSFSRLNTDDNEGLEYDDIISIYTIKDKVMNDNNHNQMNIKHYNRDGDNNKDEDDRNDEDSEDKDEHILQQLNTLSSLLNTRSDNYFQSQSSEILSDLNKSTHITNTPDHLLKSVSSSSSSPGINKNLNNFLPSSDSDTIKFTDLTQKTVVLTDELKKLSDTLDRLLYKLQANQIQLDQAEDNLDYMWYLRDNLVDNFSSNTSECSTGFGLSDIETKALLNDVDSENGSDVNEHKQTDDYWSSHCRMTQSSTHPNDYYPPVHDISSYLSSSYGTLESSFHSDLRISNEHHSSNLDSGLEQSIITCCESYCHMISSMPERYLKNSLDYHSSYTRYLSNSRIFKNHSLSKHSRFKKRRSHARRKRLSTNENSYFSTNVLPDSDGFLHPDLTFENDGPLEWSETMNVNP